MLQSLGVTEKLAQFVVDARWDDLPAQLARQVKRSLMNYFNAPKLTWRLASRSRGRKFTPRGIRSSFRLQAWAARRA
jgi:hypothetical protein